jgi:hypothetical protein
MIFWDMGCVWKHLLQFSACCSIFSFRKHRSGEKEVSPVQEVIIYGQTMPEAEPKLQLSTSKYETAVFK